MLPLVTNVLPGPAPAAANAAGVGAQAIPSSTQMDAVAAARQQLPIAVASSGAPAAYSPETMQWRQAQVERRTQSSSLTAASQTDDHDTRPTASSVMLPAAPLPNSFFNSQPIRLGTPLTSQLATQFLAQNAITTESDLDVFVPTDAETSAASDEETVHRFSVTPAQSQPVASSLRTVSPAVYTLTMPNWAPQMNLPRAQQSPVYLELRNAPIGKKPGLAQATGATAYGVAEARNRSNRPTSDTTL